MTLPLVRRAYHDGAYGQIHYRIARPATAPSLPPLLLLHQTPKSGIDYEQIMPLLAIDRVVIAPDTPGYGGSDAPPAPPSIEDYADAAMALVDALGEEGILDATSIDVMGYHTGAVTSTHLGVSRPDRIRRLVLLGLAAYDEPTRREKLERIDIFPVPRPDVSNVTDLWRIMETMHDKRIDLGWKHASLAEHLRPGDRLPWGFMAVYAYDFLGALARLEQPALILCPEDDLWVPTHKAAPLVRNGRLVEFPGAAHGFLKLDADSVAATIDAFLR